jgi:hypothetical protein
MDEVRMRYMYVWYGPRAQNEEYMWAEKGETKTIADRDGRWKKLVTGNQSIRNKTAPMSDNQASRHYHMPTANIPAAAAWAGKNRNSHPMYPADIGVPDLVAGVADLVDLAAQQQHPNQIG